MSKETTDYDEKARSDAREMIEHFSEEITDALFNDGKASDDYNNDYSGGDSYHHESHVDKSYTLLEAATILSQLSQHEETDSGLWQGLDPQKAINAMAAYTYGNAVTHYWREYIEEINSAWETEVESMDDCEEREQGHVPPADRRKRAADLVADTIAPPEGE